MALWIDSNGNLHDDMDGEALSLAAWPQGMTLATPNQIAAAIAQSPIPLKKQAFSELEKVTGPSGVVMRCMAAGVAVPVEWSNWIKSLRAIYNGTDVTSTTLPVPPKNADGSINYPAGT